jgi:hypothetical protein
MLPRPFPHVPEGTNRGSVFLAARVKNTTFSARVLAHNSRKRLLKRQNPWLYFFAAGRVPDGG